MPAFGFPCKPSVISVHIPKTAGSSFHASLKQAYGWRLKHIHQQADIARLSTGKRYWSNKPFVEALHGHIRPHENWKKQYPNAKWICWLRDPVDRVVSAYHHLEKTQDMGDRNQNLFKRLQPSLEEFLIHPDFKPVTRIYQHFLVNLKPEDFAIIGRTEFFEKDLVAIGEKIGKPLKSHRVNVGDKKNEISDELRATLAERLAAEYEVYHTFIKYFYP